MDINPTAAQKEEVYEALFALLAFAWTREQPVLDVCDSEQGKQLTGDFYSRMADALAAVFTKAGDGPFDTFLTFLIATSGFLKDREHNPDSTRSLYEIAKENYPKTLTPELDQQLEQILTLWAEGYFAPKLYPFTYEETMEDDTE